MAEISALLKESNSRIIALIGLFVVIFGLLYLFFEVMLNCLSSQTTGQCFQRYWLFYTVTVVACAFAYLPLMQIINQIAFQFKVRDDFMVQLRRKQELENIKILKNDLRYSLDEKEFSEGIRKLIGKYKEPKKSTWWKFWNKKK